MRQPVTEVHTFTQTVEAIAERLGDVPLQIGAGHGLAAASHLSGDFRATERVSRKLMPPLRGQPTRVMRFRCIHPNGKFEGE